MGQLPLTDQQLKVLTAAGAYIAQARSQGRLAFPDYSALPLADVCTEEEFVAMLEYLEQRGNIKVDWSTQQPFIDDVRKYD